MTLNNFMTCYELPYRYYGKVKSHKGPYILFERELSYKARNELYRLEDYAVSSAVSGLGLVISPRFVWLG